MEQFLITKLTFAIAATVAVALPLPTSAQTIGGNYIRERVMCGTDGSGCMESVHYYDGLGRQVQTVAVAASPQGNDIVDAREVDGAGRTVRSWNAAACGTGGAQRSMDEVRRIAIAAYGDNAPNSTIRHEQSPLGRQLAVTGPGRLGTKGTEAKRQDICSTTTALPRCPASSSAAPTRASPQTQS